MFVKIIRDDKHPTIYDCKRVTINRHKDRDDVATVIIGVDAQIGVTDRMVEIEREHDVLFLQNDRGGTVDSFVW